MIRRVKWYRNKSQVVVYIAPDRKVELVDVPSFTLERGTHVATGKRHTFVIKGVTPSTVDCPEGWVLLYSTRLGGWYLLSTSTEDTQGDRS